MGFPRVLVATPIYEAKEYCRERYVETIKQLSYPNVNWIIVDNSRTPRYSNKLKRLYPGHIHRVNRGKNSRDALANSCNFIRAYALKHGYDYILMVESDLFPPADTIQRLMRHGKRVAGGIYQIGHGDNKRWCLFKTVQKLGGLGTQLVGPDEQEAYFHKGLKQVHGMGVGCVLISKDIFERFPFWYSSADDDRMAGEKIRKHPDVYFYLDLHNAGIDVFADTDLVIEHQPSKWEEVEDV